MVLAIHTVRSEPVFGRSGAGTLPFTDSATPYPVTKRETIFYSNDCLHFRALLILDVAAPGDGRTPVE